MTTYVQSVVSYFIAPWQSLAANTPANVTVLVCEYDFTGTSSCITIQEVWVVYTEYISVNTTSILIIRTTRASVRFLYPSPVNDADLLACCAPWLNGKHNSRRRPAIYIYQNHLLLDDPEEHDFDLNHSTDIDFNSNSHNYEHVARKDHHAHSESRNSYS